MLLKGSCHCGSVRFEVNADPHDKFFEAFPDESLAEWHRSHGLEQ